MALTQISTDGVKDDAVTAGKIPANAVGSSELADNAVDTAAIADDAVTAAKIANNTITATQLNTDAVDTDALQVNSVTTAKLANDSVTSDKIPDNAVQNEHIADNSVGSDAIANGSVNTLELADQAVTLAKLEHGTSSNNGKFLRANNGADPTFETVTGTTINTNANNRIITGSDVANNINGEQNLTWNDSSGLLTVKHPYGAGGGTGVRLYDSTSTGANEGMNIEWISGTDKTSDQCRIGQFSNGTGNGSNLDFYTNGGDTGVSNRRMRIPSTGGLVVGNDTYIGVYSATDGGNMMLTVQNDAASRTDIAVSNQSTANNASSAVVLAAHGQDFILESTGSGNTTDGAGAFRISDGTSERMRINGYGSIVRSGHTYANYVTSMKTVSSSSAKNVQVLEDCYGQWLVVAKISSTTEFKGSMSSTADLDTTNNQVTGDPSWSSLFGDTYPSEVRYISASDWSNWRDTRIIDFVHGVPNGRKWKNFFTNGNSSGMPVVSGSKLGWTVAGCYDGFGRWRNPEFLNHKMADNNAGSNSANNPVIAESFFTTAGQTMNWHNGNQDAKFIASHNDTSDGQDDEWTTGWGWDDDGVIRSDEFPSKGNNATGTDLAEKNLWILIKLGSPTFGHD